jgi:hypothetical protein
MSRCGVLVLLLMFGIIVAPAQQLDWDMSGWHEVDQAIGSLPVQDQLGIEHRLGAKPTDLRAMRVKTASGPIFIVQAVGFEDGWCSPTGNCSFWVLSGDYRILLEKVTQTFKLLANVHGGLPDVMTSMHGSAFESGLSYWRFQGKHYVRVACADAVYRDADGNLFKEPHISPYPCVGKGG